VIAEGNGLSVRRTAKKEGKMLSNKGFDLWADGYDADVDMIDDDNEYPFAGYKEILGRIYAMIMEQGSCNVLDIGIGTGVLAKKLIDGGNKVTGIDFSQKMLDIAASRVPDAVLIRHDFGDGFPIQLAEQKFDFIISTYALHHLEDEAKITFIQDAVNFLAPDGKIIIGDIAFETEEAQDACRDDSGDGWDDDEFYFVMETLSPHLKDFSWHYQQISHCGGILTVPQK